MKDVHKGAKKRGVTAGAAAVRGVSSKHLTGSRLGFKVQKQHKSKMLLKNKLIEKQESELAELRAFVASMKRTKARVRVWASRDTRVWRARLPARKCPFAS